MHQPGQFYLEARFGAHFAKLSSHFLNILAEYKRNGCGSSVSSVALVIWHTLLAKTMNAAEAWERSER